MDGQKYKENLLNLPAKSSNSSISKEVEGLLAGVKRAEFGSSLAFELWKSSKNSYAYIKLRIYNRDDALNEEIEFEHIKLGLICRNRFIRKYGYNEQLIAKFYPLKSDMTVDYDYECPFELWKNVTNDSMISNKQFQQLCFGWSGVDSIIGESCPNIHKKIYAVNDDIDIT